jgi:hypothetical protein
MSQPRRTQGNNQVQTTARHGRRSNNVFQSTGNAMVNRNTQAEQSGTKILNFVYENRKNPAIKTRVDIQSANSVEELTSLAAVMRLDGTVDLYEATYTQIGNVAGPSVRAGLTQEKQSVVKTLSRSVRGEDGDALAEFLGSHARVAKKPIGGGSFNRVESSGRRNPPTNSDPLVIEVIEDEKEDIEFDEDL